MRSQLSRARSEVIWQRRFVPLFVNVKFASGTVDIRPHAKKVAWKKYMYTSHSSEWPARMGTPAEHGNPCPQRRCKPRTT